MEGVGQKSGIDLVQCWVLGIGFAAEEACSFWSLSLKISGTLNRLWGNM
jgi:hypothetical protein